MECFVNNQSFLLKTRARELRNDDTVLSKVDKRQNSRKGINNENKLLSD